MLVDKDQYILIMYLDSNLQSSTYITTTTDVILQHKLKCKQ